MKTITLQEALRQTRVLIVPVYEDDAVPASICDARSAMILPMRKQAGKERSSG